MDLVTPPTKGFRAPPALQKLDEDAQKLRQMIPDRLMVSGDGTGGAHPLTVFRQPTARRLFGQSDLFVFDSRMTTFLQLPDGNRVFLNLEKRAPHQGRDVMLAFADIQAPQEDNNLIRLERDFYVRPSDGHWELAGTAALRGTLLRLSAGAPAVAGPERIAHQVQLSARVGA